MAKSFTGEKIVVKLARLAFVENLFTPDDKGKFNCNLIIPPDSEAVPQLRAEEERLAKLAWPDKHQAMLEMIRAGNNQALKPGILKAKYDGFQGNLFLSASSKTRPTTVKRDGTPTTASDGVLYAGCHVLAHVSLWTQDNEFGQKINTNIMGLQFVSDGDAFSSGAPPSSVDEFGDLGAGDDDPMA